MIAVCVLTLSSLALAHAFSASTMASRDSDRTVAVQSSLQTTYENLADVPYDQLLAWNGIVVQRGDHVVTVAANLVQVGLIEVELTATDARSGAALGRLATYRSGEY
jgi:hypothetical protein